MKFWIKERYNPQLGTYFVAAGKMSKAAAKKHERPIYGENTMHSFATEAEYKSEMAKLKKEGKRVQ